MKQHIENLLQTAVKKLEEIEGLPPLAHPIQLDPTKDKQHGDFASNIALILAKSAKKKPRDIAEEIVKLLPPSSDLQKVEVAGPGFINFFLSTHSLTSIVKNILKEKENFGRTDIGRNKRILIEFVSSNPTGPLHVGHGRHAALGAVIANMLNAIGFNTYKEYYVNDAGRQMDILTVSVWLRYLELIDKHHSFPENAYKGSYVIEIAEAVRQKHDAQFLVPSEEIFINLPLDEPQGGDKEIYIDAVIKRAKALLGEKYQTLFDLSLASILVDIHEDLAEFGVTFDNWFSERDFVATKVVDGMLSKLKASGHTYERDGALWFHATDFGYEKDRVLVRSNGTHTYFVNDLAYHLNKFDRGFDLSINIFGSDHHGYAQHMKVGLQAYGIDPERWLYLLLQFVSLYRHGEQVAMSTRGGNFVTLRELRNEVGNDAARFFYVMRKSEQPMDFDLDLAKSQSNENPVYYVQYAYARICSVFKQLKDRHLVYNEQNGLNHLEKLNNEEERQLLNTLSRYPDIIIKAALNYEPHLLTNYLRELAADFHSYYNSHQFLIEDENLRDARLALVAAAKQTLLNGFNLLGIRPLDSM